MIDSVELFIENNSEFEAALASHKYFDSSLKYWSEYYGADYLFKLLTVKIDGKSTLIAPITIKNNELSFFGSPIEIFLKQELSKELVLVTFKKLKQEIKDLVNDHKIQEALFFTEPNLLNLYFTHAHLRKVSHYGAVDLDLGIDKIKANLRSSYKSLINWGDRKLKIEVVDDSILNQESYKAFRDFHFAVTGRQTRSDASWDAHYDLIAKGCGFILNAYLEQKLVSSCLILHGRGEAYYEVGLNDKPLMAENVPIGHYPILKAISIAKEKGLKIFNIGNVDKFPKDPKLNGISTFKRGFATSIISKTDYKIAFDNGA